MDAGGVSARGEVILRLWGGAALAELPKRGEEKAPYSAGVGLQCGKCSGAFINILIILYWLRHKILLR